MVWLTTLLLLIPQQDDPKPGEKDLKITVLKDGTLKIDGKTYWKPGLKDDLSKLERVFIRRRYMQMYQEIPGKDTWVNYTLFLDLHPEASFFNIQRTLMLAAGLGGVTKIVLRTRDRKEFVRMTLPKVEGLVTAPPKELRIVVCAGGDLDAHQKQRGKHSKLDKDAARCVVAVKNKDLGLLISDDSKDDVKAANRKIIEEAAASVEKLLNEYSKPNLVSVILDADEEVAARHIIRTLKLVQARIKRSCELVGSPRFDKYYGTFEKGQFRRKDDRKDDD